MKITSLSASQAHVVASNNGMSHYLAGLDQGRAATPHSWLYENEDATKTLERWMQILSRLEKGSEQDQKIYQFDLKQVEKFGPQGEVPPLKEAIKVDSFREQYELTNVKVKQKRSLDAILSIRPHCLQYRSFDAVVDDMRARDTLVTNSGWDLFTRREKAKGKAIQDAKDGKAWLYPAIILFRKYNGKLRVVWMYPMAMNLLEYQATQPLQEVIQSHTHYVTPWRGFEFVKKRFTELWAKHPYAFGGDTTAMDAHMQRPQNEAVAAAFSPLFKDPKQATESLLHVNDIDIVVGRNSIIADQQHGVASGSGWTQLCETIFQIIKFDEWIQRSKLQLTVEDGMGIGDDYVWFFDERPDSQSIVDFWAEDGLPGKEEKQSNEEDSCTFLQRLFLKGYMSREDSKILGGVYPTIRALNSLLWPEKFHNPKDWNSDMFCTRCFMILENTVDHPLFEDFVKFVVQGQKDLLPFAKMSASKQNAALAASRLIPGLNPSYNQEKREKPLSEFQSIKFARTL